MTYTTPIEPGFYGLGIAPKLLDILWKLKFNTPTPIQRQAIPLGLEGKDIVGVAQTGTGKTLAFAIPLIQRLAQVKGRGLVILPTRELALQADEVFKLIGRPIALRTAVLIGGASMKLQIEALKRQPHVLVVTPGRLIDHLEQRTLDLRDVRILVLDEADRMLDMGFAPQLQRILKVVPSERQTLLFSATMPGEILKLARAYMKLPVQIEIAPSGTMPELVTQEVYVVKKEDKLGLLQRILSEQRGSVLVFTRTKHGAKRVKQAVHEMGHSAAEIHSNRSLAQRREALDGFKQGKYRVLVATDVASRGLDVKGIELVINFDLPDHAEDYVHRIGRTGRAGQAGRAISLATADQRKELAAIERLTRYSLPRATLSGALPPTRFAAPRHSAGGQERYHAARTGRSNSRHFGRSRR